MCKNQEKLSKKFIFFEELLNKCVFGSFVFTVWYFRFPVLYYPAKKQHYYNEEQDLWRELKFPGV